MTTKLHYQPNRTGSAWACRSTVHPNVPVVFVVDDDDLIRDALHGLLTAAGFSVASFPSAQAFLATDRPVAAACLLLDVDLPGLTGFELQRELAQTDAPLPIIFLTGHGDIPMSVRAMKAGAVEFLTKPFRRRELLDAIQQAIERDRAERAQRQEIAELRRRYALLTMRERDVMARVTDGQLNKQIAAEFGTGEATVKEQRAQVMQKIRAASLAHLVRIAARLEMSPTLKSLNRGTEAWEPVRQAHASSDTPSSR